MPYDKPHAVSPGLWALAWRRLRSDRVAMVSLAIVVAFLLLMVLSGTGLIAKNWSKEVGVNYAPPSFVGADAETSGNAAVPTSPSASSAESEAPTELPVVDPLADALAAIRGETLAETQKSETGGVPSTDSASGDPLAAVMDDIRAKGSKSQAGESNRTELPFAEYQCD